MTPLFRASQPDRWIMPRAHTDPSERLRTYGRVQPMERPSIIARLLGRT